MNTTDTITASRERIESDLMESEPIKRVLAIENLAIVTGRAREYHGKTIQEVLSQALLQHEAVVREEMARIVEGIKQPDDPHSPYWQLGFERAKKTSAQAIRTTQPTI